MTRIHILGGTGYAGANIARIAVARGHQVVSFSKTDPAEAGADVTYRSGDLLDDAFLASAFNDTDVVISALSARGPLAREEDFRALLRKIARSEEHTSELQSLMRISYAVFCLKTKNK